MAILLGLAELVCDVVAVAVSVKEEDVVPDIDIVGNWLGVTETESVCAGVAVIVCDMLCELGASWERVWD